MKVYQLNIDDKLHTKIKSTAAEINESMKEFIIKAAEDRIKTVDYFIRNKDLQNDIENRDRIDFIKVKSIKDIFN